MSFQTDFQSNTIFRYQLRETLKLARSLQACEKMTVNDKGFPTMADEVQKKKIFRINYANITVLIFFLFIQSDDILCQNHTNHVVYVISNKDNKSQWYINQYNKQISHA